MNENKYETLSEKLFAPHLQQKDVSMLLNPDYELIQTDGAWYRILNRADWIWQGIDPIEQDAIIAAIASSTSPRTNECWLDTIAGYQEGAWVYEWVRAGMVYQKKALNTVDIIDIETSETLFELWNKATLYFTIASYPNIKSDQVALQAIALTHNAHQKALTYAPFIYKSIVMRDQNKAIKGHLYLPHTQNPVPLFFYCGDLDQRHTQLLSFYKRHLLELGFGLFVMDPPSVGDNADWTIDNDVSYIYGLMVKHLCTLSWVDANNVIFGGLRLGGNIAIRLAYTHADCLKAAISLNGYLHEIFYNTNYPDNKMTYDLYTSAIGLQSAVPSLLKSKLQSWSLKTQGLLGHSKARIPVFALRAKNHPYSSQADDKLCAQCSIMGKSIEVEAKTLYQGYDEMITLVVAYLKEQFSFDYQ